MEGSREEVNKFHLWGKKMKLKRGIADGMHQQKSLTLIDQINSTMGAAQIREELHQFINHADERVLNLIYGMMKADSEGLLTAEQQEDLDKRIACHRKGESKSFNWSEARVQIEKRA